MLSKFNGLTFRGTARLWFLTLAANFMGTFLAAFFLHLGLIPDEFTGALYEVASHFSQKTRGFSF